MAPNEANNDISEEIEEPLNARSYQIEILETALKQNTIACLGTGTGKTFIAVMLIKETAEDVRIPFDEGGKRVFFLVPTVPLVYQQMKAIKSNTDLVVKGFSGDMNVDSWNENKWTQEFIENEVLVMTAEIFRIIVDHAFITYDKIKLVIFDECHRVQGDHPYRQIMNCFSNLSPKELPKIFGLSASLINGKCKPSQLERHLRELEIVLRSSITTTSDIVNIQRYGADPDEYVVCYKPYEIRNKQTLTDLLSQLDDLKAIINSTKANLDKYNDRFSDLDLEFFNKPLKCLNSVKETLETIGPWCAAVAAQIFIEEVSVIWDKKQVLLKEHEKIIISDLLRFLIHFNSECLKIEPQICVKNKNQWPSKLQRLLDIFQAIKKSKRFLKNSKTGSNVEFDVDPEKYCEIVKSQKNMDDFGIQICCIVFVQQRITAYVLHKWVLEIINIFPELDFLKAEYIVGHGNTGIKKTSMSEKRQKGVLYDFRKKKCNVLLSTNVLEEGMDVQQCNVVIRFDLPSDYRGYVQSKGRARAKNSIYVLMSEIGEAHVRFCEDMMNYKIIEKMLLDKCHNRSLPTDEEMESLDDSLIPPYMPYGEKGARITMTSAISLINRYCASLPADMATKLTAKWYIVEIETDNPTKKEFECTLKMPINSPLRNPIVGERMPRKKYAKNAVALKACKLLDEIGELNEHLVPNSCKLQKEIEDEVGSDEEEDGNGYTPGTKRRRQLYNKHVAVFFKNSLPQPQVTCFVHVLEMNLIEPLPKVLNPRNRPIIDPADSTRGLGILLTRKLPKVNSFPIFTKLGKITVTVTLCTQEFSLSQSEIDIIKKFHQFIFSDSLQMDKNKTFCPDTSEMSCYIIPIDSKGNLEIDFDFMRTVQTHYYISEESKSFSHKGIDFTDTVVKKAYISKDWNPNSSSLNHVISVSKTIPTDPCGFAKNLTFLQYYKEKYGITIEDQSQNLLETFRNDTVHNWKPLYVSCKEIWEDSPELSKNKLRHKEFKELLVPELCILYPLPSSFLIKVQFLPTALFRLHSLLLAEELRQTVAESGLIGIAELPDNFSWPYFDLETSDKDLKKALCNRKLITPMTRTPFVPQDIIKSKDNKIITFTKEVDVKNLVGPDPSLLLQALTAKSTGDEFDLERLEMIGDSFLKYAVSVKIYLKYPNNDEGKLTKLRSALIQNLHLYKQAKKKHLPEFLICTAFNCNNTWLPPCYVVSEEDIDENILKEKSKNKEVSESIHLFFTKQYISDKCVADAVEALIGAYLLSCGQKGALMFMSWLGLNPLPFKKDEEVEMKDFIVWPPDPPSAIVGQVPNAEEHIRKLTKGFEKFERRIGYTFRDKALLLQAFTHPSFSYNEVTDCFQRLEFLGDAVLDFLITRQLYEDPNDHSPGRLTDLRSALVNNIYFAWLAVKYEYNCFLHMHSDTLLTLMSRFIDELKESEAFKFFEEHGYCLEEIECFDLDEVEVPKALGDIFESVAGAIYLDSGMSLDTVWKIYGPMMEPSMLHLTEHVPISPVRELYELVKSKNVFKDFEVKGDKCYTRVFINGKVIVGTGPNKKVAKRSAAKRAIAELKSMKNERNLLLEISA